MSDYIRTVSGVHVTPLEASEEQILIEDIAHSLSLLCRANGHYREFYSVGAHSLNCYEEAVARKESIRVQLACLLHDATEAYMSDVTRPVKKNLPDYIRFEEKLTEVIYKKYLGSDLSEEEAIAVKKIDDAMLYYEFFSFMGVGLFEEAPYIASEPNFSQGDFLSVEEKYKAVFEELIKKLDETK